MRHHALAILSSAVLSGCVVTPEKQAASQPTPSPDATAVTATEAPVNAPQMDALPTAQRVFQIQMYRFSMPAGTISQNPAFWKPADETFLGFNTHEVLNKNGLRVGRVPLADVQALLGELQDSEVAQDIVIGPGGTKEIEMRTNVPAQTIFWYDIRDAHLEGQSFARSQNLYVVAYHQLPRRPDKIYVSFAPAVRELRPQLRMDNGQVQWTPPDTIYALGIGCELGQDECVVIAPSPVATSVSSVLGAAFLIENGPAQQMERVMVIVPRVRNVVQTNTPVQ